MTGWIVGAVAAGMLYLLFRPAAKPKGAGKLEAASKNA